MVSRRESFFVISILFAVSVLCLSSNIPINEKNVSDSIRPVTRSISQSYLVRAPVVITNDNELSTITDIGNGTVNNPYVLANFNITGAGYHGISITGTTKCFRIENCWISNSPVATTMMMPSSFALLVFRL